MKTFKKVLASALAAAMVVTAFPVTNAEAATKAKLSATKATIYVGQSKTIKVTLPKGAKISSVKTSKKAVATVKKSGKKVVVKAVKAGKATVTVKVTPKKGKAKSLKATITVKNPTLTVKAAATELAVGETTTITAKATPKKTVSFKSADETIATVDAKTGVVTAVKAGTVKITATAGKLTKDVELTIKNVIFKDVKQTKVDTLEATIAGDTASLKADSVAIKNTANNIVYAVKSVTVDKADKTKVTIVTFAYMNDGKDYSVTIADTTKTITATDNKVTAVKVTPETIPYATLSTISAVATDAKGVELGTADYNNQSNVTIAGKTAEFTITPAAGGYTSGAQLYLGKKGDVAKAKVTIKSGEYDATGKEINTVESGEVTITAVDQEVVTVSDYKVRVTTDVNVTKYDDAKDNNAFSVEDSAYAFFKITNSKAKEIKNYDDYKISSSNPNVLMLTETALTGSSSKVNLYGVAAGSAYIIIKDTKNNNAVVATLPITVNAKRTFNALSLDKTSLVLSTSAGANTEVVNVTAKDQYGDKMTSGYNVTGVELLASPSGASANPYESATSDDKKITFKSTPTMTTGAYTYKVTVKSSDRKIERSQVVTVNVKAAVGTSAYAFEITGVDANNTVDTTLNDKFASAKNVTIKIVETKGGVKFGYVNAKNVVVKKDNASVGITTGASANVATFAAITTNAANNVTAAAAGTYVVSGKTTDGKQIAPTTFIVKNDTAKVTVAQAKTELSVSKDSISSLQNVVEKAFTFKFGTTDLKFTADPTVTVEYVNGTDTASNGYTANSSVFVKTATLKVTFKTGYTTIVTVDVNKAVVLK